MIDTFDVVVTVVGFLATGSILGLCIYSLNNLTSEKRLDKWESIRKRYNKVWRS